MVDSTDQTESSTPLASDNAVDQEAATDNPVLIRGMDLDVFNAAKEGKTDVLSGYDLDQILTPTKNTVLHIYIAFASSPNYVEPEEEELKPPSVVNKILQMCPALLSQENESGETALHIAARHGRADIVERLIETAKARKDLENGPWQTLIRKTNKEKDTAFHFAVRFNHFRAVEILTREDRDFSYSANDAGETPLYLAAERKYGVLFSQILSTCKDPNYQGPNGRTALHAAVIYGDEEMTTKILNKEKDLAMVADEKGWTPLHYSAFCGRASIVTQLLEADKRSAYMGDVADKKTALHIAASKGHVNVMKQLISYCPDCCEMVDQRRRNALHYALEKRRSRIVDFVMMDTWLSNILLNAKDVDGNTPLHLLNAPLYTRIPFFGDDRVDKMAFNNKNMNALNVIIDNDSEYKIFLANALKRNGAAYGHRILSENDNDGQKLKENKGGEDTETNKSIRESHLIVATLVATVTFAAGVTMPGGYYQASDQGNGMSNVSQKNVMAPAPARALAPSNGQTPGYAVLTKNTAFQIFYLVNMLALCLSTYSVLMHLYTLTLREGKERSKRFWRSTIYTTIMSVVAMMIAFTSGTYAVLGDSPALAHSGLLVVGYAFILFVYVQMVEVQRENLSISLYKLARLFAMVKSRRHID
ncbi:hypothetical protein ACE6H2_024912 [Prunus campanulata]